MAGTSELLRGSEANHLADAREGLFTRPDNCWLTPFAVAASCLKAIQAASVPAPQFICVWAQTNHVCLRQGAVSVRFRGLPVDRQKLGDEPGWPPPGDPADEQGGR